MSVVSFDSSNLLKYETFASIERAPYAIVYLKGVYDTDTWIGRRMKIVGGAEEYRTLFDGIVRTIEYEELPRTGTVISKLKCVSRFYDWLRIPVATEYFTSKDMKTLLTELCTDYGGIDEDWIDFTGGSTGNLLNTVVTEESLMTALQLLVQIGVQSGSISTIVYVDEDGILKTNTYNISTVASSTEIEQGRIHKTTRIYRQDDVITLLRVRGRYKGLAEDGTIDFVNQEVTTYLPVTSQYLIQTVTTSIAWSAADLANATAEGDSYGDSHEIVWVRGHEIQIKSIKATGVFSPGTYTQNIRIYGKPAPDRETISPDVVRGREERLFTPRNTSEDLAQWWGRRMAISYGSRSFRATEESSDNRIEVIDAASDSLLEKWGAKWHEIDNIYLPASAAAIVAAFELARANVELHRWKILTFQDSLGLLSGVEWTSQIDPGNIQKGWVVEKKTEWEAGKGSSKTEYLIQWIETA